MESGVRSSRLVAALSAVLTGAWFLGWCAMALVVGAVGALAVAGGPIAGLSMTLAVGFEVVPEPRTAGDAAVIEQATGYLAVGSLPTGHLLLFAIPLLAMVAAGLAVVHQLRAVLRYLRAGTPFLPANVRRIRVIGAVLLVGAVVSTVWQPVISAWASQEYRLPGVEFESMVEVNVGTLVAGLVVLALAEVFRCGCELAEAQRLTI